MPILKRVRWEIFAQEIAKGSSDKEAYLAAGYSDKFARENSSRLKRNEMIKARVVELQKETASKYLLTKQDMLIALGKIVRDGGSNRDKVSAVRQASKMQGFESDKLDVNINGNVKEMSDSELEEILRGNLRGCGIGTVEEEDGEE